MAKGSKKHKNFTISISQTKGIDYGRNVTKFINNAQGIIETIFNGESDKFNWEGNPPFDKHSIIGGPAFVVSRLDFSVFLDNSEIVEPLLMYNGFGIISNGGIYSSIDVDPIHYFAYWTVIAILLHKGYHELNTPFIDLKDKPPSFLEPLIKSGTLFSEIDGIRIQLRNQVPDLISSIDNVLHDIRKSHENRAKISQSANLKKVQISKLSILITQDRIASKIGQKIDLSGKVSHLLNNSQSFLQATLSHSDDVDLHVNLTIGETKQIPFELLGNKAKITVRFPESQAAYYETILHVYCAYVIIFVVIQYLLNTISSHSRVKPTYGDEFDRVRFNEGMHGGGLSHEATEAIRELLQEGIVSEEFERAIYSIAESVSKEKRFYEHPNTNPIAIFVDKLVESHKSGKKGVDPSRANEVVVFLINSPFDQITAMISASEGSEEDIYELFVRELQKIAPINWELLLKEFSTEETSLNKQSTESKSGNPEIDIDAEIAQKTNYIAKVLADSPHGHDLLDIENEVNAFATVILAKEVDPPIAIGLFGDWGSGKTFFMEKLSDRISLISKQSYYSENQTNEVFCGNVVQIKFNAWHYIESNLWASLVSHIFENLHLNISSDNEELEEKRKNNLLAELDTTIRLQNELKNTLLEVEKNLDAITEKILTEKENIEKKSLEINDIKFRDMFKGIALDNTEEIETAGKSIGIDILGNSILEIQTVAKEYKSLAGKFRALFISLLNSPGKIKRILFVIGISVIVITYSQIVSTIEHLTRIEISKFSEYLAQILTLISSLGIWLGAHYKKISKVFSILDNANKQIDRNIEENKKQLGVKLATLKRDYSQRVQKANDLKSKKSKLEDKKNFLEQEILESTSQHRLLNFIKERVSSDDYNEHLGLLSTIRKDFEKITSLMKKQQSETPDPNLPTIDRIILYIDDLDRCPPRRVVEVLQAIHLLLALPLFVVVVGVDIRWVTKSLEKEYDKLLIDSNSYNSKDSASTQDYIEKIFQIPYWIKPMSTESSVNMIEKLIGLGNRSSESGVTKEDIPLSLEKETDPVNQSTPIQELTDNQVDASIQDDNFDDELEKATNLDNEKIQTQIEFDFELLNLTQIEVEFIKSLSAIIDHSPRMLKRFINVYRIIKISNPEIRQSAFLESNKEFREVLILLALFSNSCRAVNHIIGEIQNFDEANSFGDLVNRLRNICDNDGRVDKVFFEKVLKSFESNDLTDKNTINIRNLKKWIPYVSRFSFNCMSYGNK